MEKEQMKPDFLFEVSWEVCNKVGGIHTVIASKVQTAKGLMENNYLLIGPDVWRDSEDNPEFEEDRNLYKAWREKAAQEGLRVRTGWWKIPGRPMAIIVDFTPFMADKDKIHAKFWESYKLDSISGQWDYIEPTLFGYAAGKVIESFSKNNLGARDRIVAHFHEWMTGTGLLYLKEFMPQVATVFTTHATVLGRSIAGNQLPLYQKLKQYDKEAKSNDFNVTSKQSCEMLSAQNADAFTTVSSITAMECAHFLAKEVDVVTPNGFEENLVPKNSDYDNKRKEAREQLMQVSRHLLGHELEDPYFIATSGRYEYKNKGIDLFIESLGRLNKELKAERDIVAWVLIPAGHHGPRRDLLEKLNGKDVPVDNNHVTHYLNDPEHDPILGAVKQFKLANKESDRVKIIFVPSYLNGQDGIFNMPYYEILMGMDLTVFASYYEPWGYTPLESLAFKVPTITTSLAGFGMWVRDRFPEHGKTIFVLDRNDSNDGEMVKGIMEATSTMLSLPEKEYHALREQCVEVARIALWSKQFDYYREAYDLALEKASKRTNLYVEASQTKFLTPRAQSPHPGWRHFVVQKSVPKELQPLEHMAKNLWWSWNQDAIELFESVDKELWSESGENPIVLLENTSLKMYKALAGNNAFMKKLKAVYARFREYMDQKEKAVKPRVAYFSMEFGLHPSLKSYSGGLGILAGDYLKEASDSNRDVVGVGLLYRNGYFTQRMSANGEQFSIFEAQDFSKLPPAPVRDSEGNWMMINIQLPGRTLRARIWKIELGRVDLYLLDTDFEANMDQDRFVTHQLYGGDNENRLKQELVLGIGGIRALQVMNIHPDLYHCNEGHAAFIGLERLRTLIGDRSLTFQEALEYVRSSTLFTTHTPVPAGHDTFEEGLLRMYLAHYPQRLKISWDELMGLGRLHPEDSNEPFSMSYLAVNCSQETNGVSRLHGAVTRSMFNDLYKGYTPEELHIGHVTNGIHVPTWTAPAWKELYTHHFGDDFFSRTTERELWRKIYEVPDETIWLIRNNLREKLIDYVKERYRLASERFQDHPGYILEVIENLDPNALTIGFARRFATYKRAHLLFKDLDRLAKIVNNEKRPVQFLYAGKAHPNDKAGQDLIKMIVQISKRPEFVGKIIFLQNYEMDLAWHLVTGVDVWLNTPTRPLEASGTSGQKSVMNGGLHFSVLDGWWAEGYKPEAGWAITEKKTYDNQDFQDEMDAETVYSIIENELIPNFYNRNKEDVPEEWIRYIKNSVSGIAPEFTMTRMLMDYEQNYYQKLMKRSREMAANDYRKARDLASWKKRIINSWEDIAILSVQHPDVVRDTVTLGESFEAEVVVDLKHLRTDEIGVELVHRMNDQNGGEPGQTITHQFELEGVDGSKATYKIRVTPDHSGVFDYAIRLYPRHEDLPHRQDFPLVHWA